MADAYSNDAMTAAVPYCCWSKPSALMRRTPCWSRFERLAEDHVTGFEHCERPWRRCAGGVVAVAAVGCRDVVYGERTTAAHRKRCCLAGGAGGIERCIVAEHSRTVLECDGTRRARPADSSCEHNRLILDEGCGAGGGQSCRAGGHGGHASVSRIRPKQLNRPGSSAPSSECALLVFTDVANFATSAVRSVGGTCP